MVEKHLPIRSHAFQGFGEQRIIDVGALVRERATAEETRTSTMTQAQDAFRKLAKTVKPEYLTAIERVLFPLPYGFDYKKTDYDEGFIKILDLDHNTGRKSYPTRLELESSMALVEVFRALKTLAETVKPEELEPIKKALDMLDALNHAFRTTPETTTPKMLLHIDEIPFRREEPPNLIEIIDFDKKKRSEY